MGACKGIQQATHFSWLHFNKNEKSPQLTTNTGLIHQSKILSFVPHYSIAYNVIGLGVGAGNTST